MERTEQLNELAAALALAQGEMKNAPKDSENPYFKSKYADLATIWDTIKPTLAKHGLSVVQIPEGENALTTILMHKSGQFLSGRFELKPTKDDPQGHGSAITYARRYALGAIVGIATEEDDDGNAASQKVPVFKQAEKPNTEKQPEKPLTVERLNEILETHVPPDPRPLAYQDEILTIGKKNNGKRFKDIPKADLQKARDFCRKDDKLTELGDKIEAYLTDTGLPF